MVSDTIKQIGESSLGQIISYTNRIDLSGFILQKPRINEEKKEQGTGGCSFILHQIKTDENGKTFDKTFMVYCFGLKSTNRLMEELTSACFVFITGFLYWQPIRKSYGIYLADFQITNYLDYELDKPYERGDKIW